MFGALHRRFGTIRWKLTASYAGVTVLVVLVIEALLLVALMLYVTRVEFVPSQIAEASLGIGRIMQAEFSAPDSSTEQLASQLEDLVRNDEEEGLFEIALDFPDQPPVPDPAASQSTTDTPPNWQVPVIALLDTRGQVLTATLHTYTSGSYLGTHEVPEAQVLIDRATQGITDTEQLSDWSEPGPQLVGTAPVFDRNREVVGVVYIRLQRPPLRDLIRDIPAVLLASAVPVLLISGLIGFVFGIFAGRDFSHRLKRLSEASAALATGDLSQRVTDRSVDEIGQLARQFNLTAVQLAKNVRELRLLADKNAQLAERAAHLAIVEERNRFARDLHDSVSQDLFSLTMLAAASRRLITSKPEVVTQQLDEIQDTAQHALQETRGLIFALRPALLDGRGLGQAIRDLAESARERQGLRVDLYINNERHLPLEYEQALFRIVQEALANVVRHSRVREAEVTIYYQANEICLQVCDHGRGFDTSAPRDARSIGLMSMAERSAALGGTFEVISAPGKGTTVAVSLPAPSSLHTT